MTKTLIYLACPYSHPDDRVRRARYQAINKIAAQMMAAGLHIFSPISHTRPIALAGDLPHGWEYWQSYDRAILSACCLLIVVQLDGYGMSKGIKGEIDIALELGIPWYYTSPEPDQVDIAIATAKRALEHMRS